MKFNQKSLKSKTRNVIILLIVVLVGVWAVGGFSHGPLSKIHIPTASVISQSNYHQVQLYNQTTENSVVTNQQTQNQYNSFQPVQQSQAGSGSGGGSGYRFPNPNYNKIINSITVGSNPYGIVYNSINNKIYVANSGDQTVSIIDSTNSVVTIPIAESFGSPTEMEFNANNGNVYVVNGDTTVSFLNSTNQDNTITGFAPNTSIGIAYNSNNHDMYVVVTNGATRVVQVINSTEQISATINGSNISGSMITPVSDRYNPITNEVYVLSSNGTVAVINSTNQVTKKINVNGCDIDFNCQEIFYNPNNNDMYISGTNEVNIIGTNDQVIDTIPISSTTTTGFAFDTKNGNIYVCAFDDNSVIVLNSSNQVIKTITGISGPQDAVFNPINNYVYVTNDNASTLVSVIDANP